MFIFKGIHARILVLDFSALTALTERGVGGTTFAPLSQSSKSLKSNIKLKVLSKMDLNHEETRRAFLVQNIKL
jgi:hypothetical protein